MNDCKMVGCTNLATGQEGYCAECFVYLDEKVKAMAGSTVAPFEREPIAPETRAVYAWLGEDEVRAVEVATLRAEALEEVPSLAYLARNLEELFDSLGDEQPTTVENVLARCALARVQWKMMAQWVLRDAVRWPIPDGWYEGKGLR